MHRLDFGPLDFDHDFGPGRAGGIIGGILGLLFTLAIITLVVLAIVYLARRLRTTGAPTVAAVPQPAPARALLDERFARGEIDADEYGRRRALLEGPPPTI